MVAEKALCNEINYLLKKKISALSNIPKVQSEQKKT